MLAIVSLAAYVRLAGVEDNPGWYADEGTHLNIAANLLQGRAQYLAVRESTLLFARLPLFDWLLAAVLWGAGEVPGGAGPGGAILDGVGPGEAARGMALLRGLTGGLGVLTTLLLYGLARRTGGASRSWLGVLAALPHAVYPQAVVYSRLGFSYNLLAPLLLAALWGTWEFVRATAAQPARVGKFGTGGLGWLAVAALSVGAGAVTDLWGLALAPALMLAAATRGWRAAVWAGGLAVLPLALFAGLMLLAAPEAFVFDARYTLLRLNGQTLAQQLALLADNLTTLAAQDGWMALGMLGLFVLRPVRLRRLALLFFWLPLVLVGRSAALVSLSFYYMIPLQPLVALGLATLAGMAAERLAKAGERALRLAGLGRKNADGRASRRLGWLAPAALLGAPLAVVAGMVLGQTQTGFSTAIDPFLVSAGDAQRAAAFVNAQALPGDLVIASPALAWLLPGRTADFQMALASNGQATPHLPPDVPASRFAFDPGFEQARFVVVDNLWRNWAVIHMPGLPTLEGWRLAFEAGDVSVYEAAGGEAR